MPLTEASTFPNCAIGLSKMLHSTADLLGSIEIMQTYGQELCERDDILFEECYRYQYVVSSEASELSGFTSVQFYDRWLHVGRDQFCDPLCDKAGNLFGYVVGIAVDGEGNTLAEAVSKNFDISSSTAVGQFEDFLVEAVGRFVAIVNLENRNLFYQDASGMLGALHNSAINRIASTLYLALDGPLQKSTRFFDPTTGDKICEPVLHFTPDPRVERINPSFRFDFETGQSERFWPRQTDVFGHKKESYHDVLEEIVTKERNVLSALLKVNDVALSMSGGYDSRAIYACASPETRRSFRQIFSQVNRKIGWYDAKIAGDIVALDGLAIDLSVATHLRKFGSDSERDKAVRVYELASGNQNQPPDEVVNGACTRIIPNTTVLRGQQIPILKAFAVGRAPTKRWDQEYAQRIISEAVVTDAVPKETQVAISDAIGSLYNTLPEAALCRSVDLLMVEVVNGPELAGNFSGFTNSFYISPFNSRRFIQLFAGFGLSERRDLTAFDHLMLHADSEVCGVAFTYQVKHLHSFESEEDVLNRHDKILQTRKSYEAATGTKPRPTSIWRYSLGGNNRLLPIHVLKNFTKKFRKA